MVYFKACLMNNLLLIGSIQEGNLKLSAFNFQTKNSSMELNVSLLENEISFPGFEPLFLNNESSSFEKRFHFSTTNNHFLNRNCHRVMSNLYFLKKRFHFLIVKYYLLIENCHCGRSNYRFFKKGYK